MLITSFASGELSDTLFGRTDLPQYYQGVSRLENFDVIPTGGIRRRNGTRRVLELKDGEGNPLEGRLIPFTADRDNRFLVVISPGSIRIFKEGEQVFGVSDALYAIDEEVDNALAPKIDGFMIRGVSVAEGGSGYRDGDEAAYAQAEPDGKPGGTAAFTVAAPRPATGVTVALQDFFTARPPAELWLPGARGEGLIIAAECREIYKASSVTVRGGGSGYAAGDRVTYEHDTGTLECTVGKADGQGRVTGAEITRQEYFEEDLPETLEMSGGSGSGLELGAETARGFEITGVSVKEGGSGYDDGEEIAWKDSGGARAAFAVRADTGARSLSLKGSPVFTAALPARAPLAPLSGEGRGAAAALDSFRKINTTLKNAEKKDGRIVLVLEDETAGGRSQLYKYNGPKAEWEKAEGALFYQTMEDIRGIQYAQKYDCMVLVHRMYRPLLIMMASSAGGEGKRAYAFSVRYLAADMNMNNRISTALDEKTADPAEVRSDGSLGPGFLETAGNYPGCAAWFAGRLLLASTENARQRVWASRIAENNVFNFSTKTRFVTLSEEVIAVAGKAVAGEREITGIDPETMGRLLYVGGDRLRIKPGIFPAGAAVTVLDAVRNRVVTDLPIPPNAGLTDAEIKALNAWRQGAEAALSFPYTKEYFRIDSRADGTGTVYSYLLAYSAYSGTTSLVAYTYYKGALAGTAAHPLGQAASDETAALVSALAGVSGAPGGGGQDIIRGAVKDHINSLKERHGKFNLRGTDYTGAPGEIYQNLFRMFPPQDSSIFYVYRKTVTEDEYPVASDGFTFEIASGMCDSIQWLGQSKNLLIGTETAEWVVPAGVTAVNIQAVLNSRWGSGNIQGTAAGDAFCFFQSGKKALVEYYIPQQDNNFRANNMAMLSPHMLGESPASGFGFASAPCTRIFVPREDGIVVSLLYERSTGTFAWGRVITGGRVKSAAVLPGEHGEDEAYLVAERDGRFFLERLDGREKVYLDSNRPWTGSQEDWDDYDNNSAVVWDETAGRIYPLGGEAAPPVPGGFSPPHVMHIGYPFTSRVKSMPVLANDRMKQNNIKALKARFRDSFMPRVRSEPNGAENTVPCRGKPGEGFTGVVNIPFPGVFDRDVFFEFIFSDPRRCEILAVSAEVN